MYFPEGTTIVSSVGYGLLYSSLDSRMSPHDGYYLNFKQDFAGVGGDTSYVKTEVEARPTAEIFPDADIVGFIKVAGGNITGLRGEGPDHRQLLQGWRDDPRLRELRLRCGRQGYGHPARRQELLGARRPRCSSRSRAFSPDFGLRGAVFADAGTLWDVDIPAGGGPVVDPNIIRSSVGGSVLWESPFGILRADIAYALTKAKTDTLQWFRFSAGRTF